MTYQDTCINLIAQGYKHETNGFIDIKGVRHLVEYWVKGEEPQVIVVHNNHIATQFREVIE